MYWYDFNRNASFRYIIIICSFKTRYSNLKQLGKRHGVKKNSTFLCKVPFSKGKSWNFKIDMWNKLNWADKHGKFAEHILLHEHGIKLNQLQSENEYSATGEVSVCVGVFP